MVFINQFIGGMGMINFSSIKLDRESSNPLYMQLYAAIREMIGSGALVPGTRLPSVRNTAEAMGVNLVTAVSAYKKLESEGLIQSRPGSGTYISDDALAGMSHKGNPEQNLIHDEVFQQEDTAYLSSHITITQNTINFASATPSPNLFPVDDFKTAMNEVLDRDKGNAFSYQESLGFYPLRESIVGILQRQGISCTPDEIHVISGAQQGIDLISKALLKQGDGIITESPTYTGAIAVFKSRDAKVLDVQMEEDGANLGHLEYILSKYKPRIIYTIPSFQNPTGSSYSAEKRLALLKLAEKYDCYIIEDDYVSDLDFEGRGYSPLKALDRNNRVIFIKSFSKIFMPGLRLGFMLVPSKLSQHLLEAKHTTDISTSGLIQRAFDLYIRKGYWDSHFTFMYNIYKERYDKIIESLEGCLPGPVKWIKPGGGLNIWLSLPYGFPINNLVALAAARDIVFAPGRIFYSAGAPQAANNIRLSFAAVATPQIEKGISELCGAIRQLMGDSPSSKSMLIL